MKNAIIGGFISLIGTLGILVVSIIASNQLTTSWSTPPGRFLTTISEISMMPIFIISSIFLILGFVIMIIEYFKKQ